MTPKDSEYVKIYSVNPLYLILSNLNGYSEENNGNKYLTLIATNECYDRYIFYVNESIQTCTISGETLPVKADFNHAWRHD